MAAKIAVSDIDFISDKLFDYSIPENLKHTASVGSRVLVGFGRADRKTKGIILEISQSQTEATLKPILSVLDNSAPLSPEFIKIVSFIKKHYFSTYYEASKTVLPYGINFNIEESFAARPRSEIRSELSQIEEEIYSYLAKSGRPVPLKKLISDFEDSARIVMGTLKAKGAVEVHKEARRRIGDNTVKLLSITEEGFLLQNYKKSKNAAKAKAVLDFLEESGEVDSREVAYMTGASSQTVNNLIKKGLVLVREEEVYRLPEINSGDIESQPIVLNEEQDRVFKSVREKEGKYSPFVLRGITGSGKTHVYLKLCESCLSRGKTAVILMPEIALTSQIIKLFYARFGRKVALLHSGLSMGEKTDEWKRLKKGEAVIAIGTRSAVFAPVDNIGIIILDEEQEHTYKSEMTPRYSARDIALLRAKYHQCPVIFSSATPSVATYSKAKSGQYGLLTLNKRFSGNSLPSVIIADMRMELANGNTGIISDVLRDEIQKNLDNGEQSLLFLNRRGYNYFISCRNCGEAVNCPKCSISLNYHAENGRLMCHHCGFSTENSGICPRCGEKSLKYFGTGTQKVVGELQLLFPEAKILRMDADTTARKNAHDSILTAFHNDKADILVGTQMIAKGLDFPNVTLSAVVLADFAMYADDYRANEKTFAQIAQVIGRAGRAEKPGRAVIQTFSPNNKILSLAVAQDYEKFYYEEIKGRKALIYPPYCDICQITFDSPSENDAIYAAGQSASKLGKMIAEDYSDVSVIGLGPSQARILKVNNIFKYKLLLKCRLGSRFYEYINEFIRWYHREKSFRKVLMTVEYNPETIS